MPRKSVATVQDNHRQAEPTSSPSSPERMRGPLSVIIDGREPVKVNNASLTELKNACDDALKRYLSHPELFKQIYLHTDIRLGLGWLSVFTAAGTALYGYKVDFEESKPIVWAGLCLYIVLTTLQTLYAYFIEGDTVFVGRRKTFSKRIITERITISSRSLPVTVAPPKIKNSSNEFDTLAKPAPPPHPSTRSPSYQLTLSYVRSTSGGKNLLGKGKMLGQCEYSAFFDEEGRMDQERFEKWVGELVENAMEGRRD